MQPRGDPVVSLSGTGASHFLEKERAMSPYIFQIIQTSVVKAWLPAFIAELVDSPPCSLCLLVWWSRSGYGRLACACGPPGDRGSLRVGRHGGRLRACRPAMASAPSPPARRPARAPATAAP